MTSVAAPKGSPARLAAVLVLGWGEASVLAGPTTSPATARAMPTSAAATTQAASRAVIEPAAAPLLAKIAAAYAAERPRRVSGRLVGTFDVAGRQKTYRLPVVGVTDGHGRFRHDAAAAGLIVSDGRDAYLYDARRDAFAELTAADRRLPADEVSQALIDVLLDENPALLLTLTDDPAGLLARSATRVAAADVAGRPATRPALTPTSGLVLTRPNKTVTLWLTAAGDVTAATIDYRPLMQARQAAAVKAARVELTYDEPSGEPPAAGAFSWRPPASATEFDVGESLVRSTSRPATP